MCPSQNIQELLDEFKANKSIALFLGAGSDITTQYPNTEKYKSEFFQNKDLFQMNWNNLLLELSKAACIDSEEQKAINEIKSSPLKAAILKNKLGGSYIPIIQNWLYTRCNRSILLDSYEYFEIYKESQSEYRLKSTPFASLFVIADIILRQPSVKVVLTQNYNNFLSEAMKILLEKNKEDYPFRQNCKPIDIYDGWRDMPFDENVFFIYHVHGFIPPPSEMIPQRQNNHIVLSDEEFHQLSKDVFSWQNVAQLNYLTHYTCILLGLSLEDLTSLRLLRYANLERSSEKVYWIKAGDGGEKESTQLRLLMEYFESQNLCVVNDANGYSHFYHTLMETVKHKDNGK
jgi:hypothetical protein